MTIFKKLLQVFALYLLFGLVIALLITFPGGAYLHLIVEQTMGFMTIGNLLLLNIYLIFLWLPLILLVLLAGTAYVSSILVRVLGIIIVVIFLLLLIRILLKKK